MTSCPASYHHPCLPASRGIHRTAEPEKSNTAANLSHQFISTFESAWRSNLRNCGTRTSTCSQRIFQARCIDLLVAALHNTIIQTQLSTLVHWRRTPVGATPPTEVPGAQPQYPALGAPAQGAAAVVAHSSRARRAPTRVQINHECPSY
eukprot:COSAG05_NODE_1391_length_5001_cov_6495.224194_3_plen_149_part_00